ncbi:hypothetical protein L195_g021155 [Trifolium pratense]|uniref:Uncharacterized protein n=1 Tax=Trifolium pratense TaxID=57577 RepID=A0A2K3N4G4_TRIPR|nr:hypothetical protein L195_g021155 [Trifolium pratense]
MPNERGGLGIKRIDWFDQALLTLMVLLQGTIHYGGGTSPPLEGGRRREGRAQELGQGESEEI